MKVGGNASATEYFTKHAGTALLNDADTKKKYHSPAAESYRAELASRVAEDAKRFPAGIWVEGMVEAAPTAKSPTADEDDFFDSWDKPEAPASAPATTSPTPPPTVGRTASASAAPRTVTSSSLRSASTGPSGANRPKLGAARLGSSASSLSTSAPSTPGAGAGPKKSKLGGLGAKKANAPLDFASAEKAAQEQAQKAKEAEERARAEEEERRRKEEEAAAAAAAKAKTSAPAAGAASTSAKAKAATAPVKKPAGNEQDMARLGMGMKRLAFASAPAAAPKKT
jgi:ADP-ribosylation factor GTPase-activating protein 2/3